jgi:hypothetical protein
MKKPTPPNGPWRFICPAEDPKSARDFVGALVFDALWHAGEQLGLRQTWDEQQQKFYQGLPRTSSTKSRLAVVYPSGASAERHPGNNAPQYAPARPSAAPLVRAEPDIKVSKNFSLSEFRPKSSAYDGLRLAVDLVELLERIRAAAGGPIQITSGYRPPAYNQSVGGESSSFHLDGWAADIYAPHLTVMQLHTVCQRVVGEFGGVGYYPSKGFCHVDVRGYGARWTG